MTMEALFEEIVEKGKEQMIVTKEAYDALVEEVIEDHVDLDEIDIDEDTEGLEDQLRARWDDYLATIDIKA